MYCIHSRSGSRSQQQVGSVGGVRVVLECRSAASCGPRAIPHPAASWQAFVGAEVHEYRSIGSDSA